MKKLNTTSNQMDQFDATKTMILEQEVQIIMIMFKYKEENLEDARII